MKSEKKGNVFIRKRKVWFYLHMSRILFAAKDSWMMLGMSIPLFVGSYLKSQGGLLAVKREKKMP